LGTVVCVKTQTITLETGDTLVTDVTAAVASFARDAGADGLVNVFVPHATAGVALIETGSGSERDLAELLERTFPRDDRYVHRHGSSGHGGDHILPAFVAPSITIPVVDGELALGTWQSLVLVDPNRDNPRRTLRLSFVPG
jgi:secondary thiamine-phosphate synthase enzyme